MSALLANQTEYRFSTGIARAGQLFKTGLMSSPAAMATDSVSSDARPRKSVRFAGTKCIGYDAELPVVVHYGGVGRQPWDQNHAADTTLPYTSLLLEAQARDLYVVSDEDKQSPRAQPDPRDLCQRLDREYARELLEELRTRGLTPLIQAAADEDDDATAAASCADLKQLRAQLCVADLVYALAQVRSARSGEEDETSELDSFNAQQLLVLLEDAKGDTKRMNDVLGKLEFAKKGIEGLVDDGYVFGRRFLSVEAYVSTLSHPELFELAEQRSLTLPALSESDIAKLKVSDRDLRGAYSTGAGKQLKKLTLRELVVEAQARDIEIKDARDANGKKSKKAWVAKLKPALHQEALQAKVMAVVDPPLRAMIEESLEQEMQQQQTEQILQILHECLQIPKELKEQAVGTPDIHIAADSSSHNSGQTPDEIAQCFLQLFERLQLRSRRNESKPIQSPDSATADTDEQMPEAVGG